MKLLLDTHIFLWVITGDARVSAAQRDAIRSPDSEVYLSVVSLWEVIIKYQLGKLSLPQSPDVYVPTQRVAHRIMSLAVDEESVARVALLPPLHRDPFDRLLIGQALHHDLTFVTVDAAIRAYPGLSVL